MNVSCGVTAETSPPVPKAKRADLCGKKRCTSTVQQTKSLDELILEYRVVIIGIKTFSAANQPSETTPTASDLAWSPYVPYRQRPFQRVFLVGDRNPPLRKLVNCLLPLGSEILHRDPVILDWLRLFYRFCPLSSVGVGQFRYSRAHGITVERTATIEV